MQRQLVINIDDLNFVTIRPGEGVDIDDEYRAYVALIAHLANKFDDPSDFEPHAQAAFGMACSMVELERQKIKLADQK